MWRKLSLIIVALILVACSGVEQLDTAPAKPADDNFRSDTSKRVAATGKPQFIELWAEW